MITFAIMCALLVDWASVEGMDCPVPMTVCDCLSLADKKSFEKDIVHHLEESSNDLLLEFDLNFTSLGPDFDFTKRLNDDIFHPYKWFRTRRLFNEARIFYRRRYLFARTSFLFRKKIFPVHIKENQVGCTANISKTDMECLVTDFILKEFCINTTALQMSVQFPLDEIVCTQRFGENNETYNIVHKCCSSDMHEDIHCKYLDYDKVFEAVLWISTFCIYLLLIHIPSFQPKEEKSLWENENNWHMEEEEFRNHMLDVQQKNFESKEDLHRSNLKFLFEKFPVHMSPAQMFLDFIIINIASAASFCSYKNYDFEVLNEACKTLRDRGLDSSDCDTKQRYWFFFPFIVACLAVLVFFIIEFRKHCPRRGVINQEQQRCRGVVNQEHRGQVVINQEQQRCQNESKQYKPYFKAMHFFNLVNLDLVRQRCFNCCKGGTCGEYGNKCVNFCRYVGCSLVRILSSTIVLVVTIVVLIIVGLLFIVSALFCFIYSAPFHSFCIDRIQKMFPCCCNNQLAQCCCCCSCRSRCSCEICKWIVRVVFHVLFSLILFSLSFFLCFPLVALIELFIIYVSVELVQYSDLYIAVAIGGVLLTYIAQLLRIIRKEHDRYVELALKKIKSKERARLNSQPYQGYNEGTSSQNASVEHRTDQTIVRVYTEQEAKPLIFQPEKKHIKAVNSMFYIVYLDNIYISKRFIHHRLSEDLDKVIYQILSTTVFLVVVGSFMSMLSKLQHISNWDTLLSTLVASAVPVLINYLLDKGELYTKGAKKVDEAKREKKFKLSLSEYTEYMFIKESIETDSVRIENTSERNGTELTEIDSSCSENTSERNGTELTEIISSRSENTSGRNGTELTEINSSRSENTSGTSEANAINLQGVPNEKTPLLKIVNNA